MTASPTKLRNGTWGARVQGSPAKGDVVTIRTATGKEWTAVIETVLWTDGTVSICATRSTDRQPAVSPGASRVGSYRSIGARTQARQRATGWTGCSCGSNEDHPRASDCASCRHDY
jgi:hypothetical protein